jgi:SAM-dependent methyltransferase
MNEEALRRFKEQARKNWGVFAPLEIYTVGPAANLVAFTRVGGGERVLDVGCGTGAVAIAAARRGAQAVALDISPELCAKARENAEVAGVEVDVVEGDAEALPFEDASFDVVFAQFIFVPRPEVATHEMMRVLRPGGVVAFATWTPELCMGRLFALASAYAPPPPPGLAPPAHWGTPEVMARRLDGFAKEVVFDMGTALSPFLSVPHVRVLFERCIPLLARVVQSLQADPERLRKFRCEFDAIVNHYFDTSTNTLRQDYLLTRAVR